ncbi:hypothetical protein VY88_26430 [Azospirillum thiophilum]|uniref:Uncharacterized protein n=1 Tax=Azospirillum thiophilum TaxID=528244 RepID=A0AAC9EYL0_9PROT|nr:hypothetical protein [Azospirillum thiophilum]ALG75071.1 hypothetical protein AL072_29340 [Azospirillum thiophilum]KJR62464.1 hypothetical protein VY88_26430 [Azospirillum thiophilum]
MTDLPATFHELISASIDESGVWPHQMIVRRDGKLTLRALALPPEGVMAHLGRTIRDGADELIYGMDRYTQPGQGTEFADCIAAGWYRRDVGWRIGVIDYRHDPRIVRPWNWGNAWWIAAVGHELRQVLPDHAVVGHA